MRFLPRVVAAGAFCCLSAGGFLYWATQPEGARPSSRLAAAHASVRSEGRPNGKSTFPDASVTWFPDPAAPGTNARVFIDSFAFDNAVFSATARHQAEVRDQASLDEYRRAIAGRVTRAKEALAAKDGRLALDPNPTPDAVLGAIGLCHEHAFVALYAGDHDEAAKWLGRGLEIAREHQAPDELRAHFTALLGVNALRRGEQDNCIGCVGPSSCIFPLAKEAVHLRPAGSREAVKWFSAYLQEWPGDLRVRWLLNIAHMTLGEYPQGVPPRDLIPVAPFRSKKDVGRFENVATRVGLVARGPDLAGGCLFDDFNGDGRPDVFTTTFDVNHGASLYINKGDGTFEDRSVAGGLDDQVYCLNASKADYDNDGDLDVLMLRGAWEKPARMSLLRNRGDGTFEDVTVASGLGEPIASESGVWGDYDDDGRLDLFVCGEYLPPLATDPDQPAGPPDPRNRCRLYHNQGDGTFVDVAAKAGVINESWAKGAAWGDYDDDGRIDLFVSNMGAPPRLYHNEGDGTFVDMAPSLGLEGPPKGFSCMFWDYDDDGRQDLFVNNWGGCLAEVVGDFMGLPIVSENHAHLYRNLGKDGFREMSREAGLARPMPVMSVNAGDLDNDGDLDIHLGTGWMSLTGLVPDMTYLNEKGGFEDVTESSGTGHLQKGHGVSFADWDDDGDLDFFVVLGGGYPGDRGYNALFQNPGQKGRWLKVRLIGTKTNRSAIGAKLRVVLKAADGSTRSIHRVIGNNGSFGGNSLVEFVGLGDAAVVDSLTVSWPTSKTVQTFKQIAADQSLEITEGADAPKVLPRRPLTIPTR
jgi:hypothetical protein